MAPITSFTGDFFGKFILKINRDIAIQSFKFVCYVAPSDFKRCLWNSLQSKAMLLATFPENFSAIDPLVAEIYHFKVLSSAQHSRRQRGLLTHPTCVLTRVFTRIVLTAKRSYSRTHRGYQNVPWTFRNLFQLVWQPKNVYFLGLCSQLDTSGRQLFPLE